MLWLAMVQEAVDRARVSLAALFDEHAPTLLRQAHRLCGPGVDPDDVVQDVFLIANDKLEQIDPDRRPGGFLYGVMRNVIREHRRRSRRTAARETRAGEEQKASPSAPAAPDDAAEAQSDRDRLHRCLERLPGRQREAIVLCELEQMSAKEAAELMGTSENAVFVLLTRGRKALSHAWLDDERVDEQQAQMRTRGAA